jgi:hypothetical protein
MQIEKKVDSDVENNKKDKEGGVFFGYSSF